MLYSGVFERWEMLGRLVTRWAIFCLNSLLFLEITGQLRKKFYAQVLNNQFTRFTELTLKSGEK